ncbi:MAG: aminotransferase class V-fold PLP-dependent enzyme [Sphingomonadales bacterium]
MLDDGQKAAGEGYALYHSIGLYPGKESEIRAALDAFASEWCRVGESQWAYAGTVRGEFMDRWSRLIGAPKGSLTTTENVTASLYSFMGSLSDETLRGRKVLVAGDCFPSVHFLLSGMAGRRGFTLETVSPRQGDGFVRDDDFIAQWTGDVALALITWVTSTSSKKADLEPLVAHGRRMGSVIGVDITQGIGVLPFDVATPEVDFAISTSLKWLCGVPGAGILYVRPTLIADLRPEFRGWFSQPDPFSWNLEKFEYARDIHRFDHGTQSPLPFAASLPGLRWHETTGRDAIRAHNLTLTERLIDAGLEAGWDIVTPLEPDRRGGSIMIRLADEFDPVAVIAKLRECGVVADNRSQVLRFSPGPVTSMAGIESIIGTLREIV